MKRLLPLVLLFVNAAAATAQWTYGNEWIDHSRQYWRFDVYSDGVLRIDSEPMASTTPRLPQDTQSVGPVALLDRISRRL